MKEFRLSAWPDLPVVYQHTAYHRMLSDMSHRYMTVAKLVSMSGIRRQDVRKFVDMLETRGVLLSRDGIAAGSFFNPLSGWVRRTFSGVEDRY